MGVANISGNILTDSGASLSSYLPLTGGTLTGALNGTSATFSGDLTIDTNTFFVDSTNNRVGIGLTNPAGLFHIKSLSGNAQMFLQNSAGTETLSITQNTIQTASATNLILGTDGTARLTIASTGAATFSSSVKSVGRIFSTSDASFGDMLSTTGSIVMSYDSGGQQGYLTSRNYSTSTDTPLNFGASKHIFSGGNVGIGTNSPDGVLTIRGANDANLLTFQNTSGGTAAKFQISENNGLYITSYEATSGRLIAFNTQANGVETLRLSSDGYVLISTNTTNPGQNNTTTGNSLVGGRFFFNNGGSDNIMGRNNDGTLISWRRGGVEVGTIGVTSSSTSYNTSSDYRLKEDLKDINGLEKVAAIKVYDFKWKTDDSRMDGVIAHELQEVLPYAVIGKKDEVDEDGNAKMQGVDYSKIVPVLVKAIQELTAKVEALEAK